MRRFYTFYGGMVEVIKGYFLSCGDIWCSILVYHCLFAVCGLLVSLVVCCAVCSLIMRYRANDSLFCLLVVHIRQRAFLLVHIERYYFLLCGMVLMKCIELKYIAFNSVLYRCRWFSLILCLSSSLQCIRKQIRRHK